MVSWHGSSLGAGPMARASQIVPRDSDGCGEGYGHGHGHGYGLLSSLSDPASVQCMQARRISPWVGIPDAGEMGRYIWGYMYIDRTAREKDISPIIATSAPRHLRFRPGMCLRSSVIRVGQRDHRDNNAE